ncbi:MAG TPA: hypothetical protein VGC27_09860, partial [Rhizomicrobium sp.]
MTTPAQSMETEPRCIYCPNPKQTKEHMPHKDMFCGKLRPKGMEFDACKNCNSGTSVSDAVAVIIACWSPDFGKGSWQLNEKIRKLRSTIAQKAPD